jgi:Uncharacterized proteins of the AP superfamily
MKISFVRLILIAAWFLPVARAAEEKPALVVAISIDQFRGDYLTRFGRFFGEGGFNLFLEQGAHFANCHHAHSHTKTGPGHAVMLTGVHANFNGIIGNDWIDRRTFERVSCVGDTAESIIGLPAPAGPSLPGIGNPRIGRSPRNLLASTVGDELKIARGGRPKVIGIANKDRGAILMAGRMADAAYFMENGSMVSSTYYQKELPAWAREWNAAKKADAYFGKVWERVLPESEYACQGPDDMAGEDQTASQLGHTFPKTVTGGETAPGPRYYDAFENTPFSNEVIADFVRTAIEHEQLGKRAGITDLLCISFSANDRIGHLYGPDSHEIMDNVVRMDRTLAELFAFLDRHVGLKRCTIVLTADHGASSMPEYIHSLRPDIPAGRINGAQLLNTCEDALNRAFGPLKENGRWVVRDDASFLLHPTALAEKGVSSEAAQVVVRDALLTLDFVLAAYTREELENGKVHDALGQQALLSFNRARSGDVYFQAKPYFVGRNAGTNHGTPHSYDTHVPLAWFGVGVKPGVYTERVHVADLAPTLSHILGLPAPPLAKGRVLF